jgi:hypothetical protein
MLYWSTWEMVFRICFFCIKWHLQEFRIYVSFSSCCLHGCAQSTLFVSVRPFCLFSFFFFFSFILFLSFAITHISPLLPPASESVRREKKKKYHFARSHHPTFWVEGVEEKKRMKSRIRKRNAVVIVTASLPFL